MFRLWAKEWKDNRMVKDYVVVDADEKTRTSKVLDSLDEACHYFDLEIPIWLDKNIDEFKRYAKARFDQDSFIEDIPFDYLEIHVIEEA